MTDYLWPTSVIPARSEIMLRDLSARFPSPFTGTARTYQRPGGELRMMRLDLPPMTVEKKAAVVGLLSKLRGGVHRVWCKDHSYVKRGSFPATELLYNGTFANGTAGWSASVVTMTAADGVASLQKDPALGGYVSQTISIVSGAHYVARLIGIPIVGTLGGIENRVGSSAGASTYLAGSPMTSAGYRFESWTAAATSAYYSLTAPAASTAGDRFDVPYVSVSRCALIAGASQTGAVLNIDALPVSTAGLLLEGDQVQIGEELLTVAAPLNSTAAGVGSLVLHRPPRSAPADNAPVIIHEPMGLFMLAENENGWQNVPGRFANASVSLIEAPR